MSVRIIIGDALTELRKLPPGSVHCCVTSPPYYGLRDYGTATWEGGDPGCNHLGTPLCSDKSRLHGYSSETIKLRTNGMPFRAVCLRCGARRIDAQIGLEPTPEAYVAALVAVFREVRRVLRKDATLWLNIGDSYSGHNLPGWRPGNEDKNRGNSNNNGVGYIAGMKPKDLIGIPWMVAFALRADGWYLRQDIIWSKPNPMPESVTDRCTKAHEYLFLLSKSERYYFDAAAIAEDAISAGDIPLGSRKHTSSLVNDRRVSQGLAVHSLKPVADSRNKRSVWTIATQPYADAHFATMPPALVEPCILAGCPVGGTVLDPFLGAGTTALVADRLGRNAIGIELNPEYVAMARRRIEHDAGMFAQVAAD